MQRKVQENEGIALVILLLLLGIAVVLLLIAIPHSYTIREDAAERLDREYELAAEDLARLTYVGSDQHLVAVYDAEHKAYLEVSDYNIVDLRRLYVEGYGSTEANKGKYLVLTFAAEGEMRFRWTSREGLIDIVQRAQAA